MTISQFPQLSGLSYEELAKKVKEFSEIVKRTGEVMVMPAPQSKPPYPITARIQFDKTGRVL